MNKVNRESIKQLIESEDNATVSLYLPTHRFPTSEHITEDKIRFKNLIRSAKEALSEKGIDDAIVAQIIGELENGIYENDAFWQNTTDGLAVFCSPAGLRYFHLPMECEEKVSVGDRFDVAPLLALDSYDTYYYLLALAMHRPSLFKGDMYGLELVDIELPKSPEEALGIDEMHSNSKTVRAGGGYGPGNPPSGSHGQGDSRQAGQEERLKYFRIIEDKILSSTVVEPHVPLLLAGTEDEVSGYRESSKNKLLLKSHLSGNYTESAPHEIHASSWPLIVDELNNKERAQEVDKVNNLLGTGRASTNLEEITSAAEEGRVDTLLIAMFAMTRDTVKDSSELVRKLVFPENYESGRLASCARKVFDQGGKIVALYKDDMPAGAFEAATYRY